MVPSHGVANARNSHGPSGPRHPPWLRELPGRAEGAPAGLREAGTRVSAKESVRGRSLHKPNQSQPGLDTAGAPPPLLAASVSGPLGGRWCQKPRFRGRMNLGGNPSSGRKTKRDAGAGSGGGAVRGPAPRPWSCLVDPGRVREQRLRAVRLARVCPLRCVCEHPSAQHVRRGGL